MATTMPTMAKPPITPPAIAPALLLDPLLPVPSDPMGELTEMVWLETLKNMFRTPKIIFQQRELGTYVSTRCENKPPSAGLRSYSNM